MYIYFEILIYDFFQIFQTQNMQKQMTEQVWNQQSLYCKHDCSINMHMLQKEWFSILSFLGSEWSADTNSHMSQTIYARSRLIREIV